MKTCAIEKKILRSINAMHKYNPLALPEIITIIIQKQMLEELRKNCWINRTWYKEIKQEFRKRWKQVILYNNLEHEKNKSIER